MLRKYKDPAASVSNRENQSRSRARHRMYVEDLEKRLQQHESLRTQATLEMQAAARAVAAENQALRNFITSRGFTASDIDAYVHSATTVQVKHGDFGAAVRRAAAEKKAAVSSELTHQLLPSRASGRTLSSDHTDAKSASVPAQP